MGKVVNLSAAVPIRSGDPGANQIFLKKNLFPYFLFFFLLVSLIRNRRKRKKRKRRGGSFLERVVSHLAPNVAVINHAELYFFFSKVPKRVPSSSLRELEMKNKKRKTIAAQLPRRSYHTRSPCQRCLAEPKEEVVDGVVGAYKIVYSVHVSLYTFGAAFDIN